MTPIPTEDLKKEIQEILKTADLNVTTAKTVRLQLQEKFGCDLIEQKKEIGDLVKAFVDALNEANEDSEDEESEEEEKKSAAKRKAPPPKKQEKKKKKGSGSDNDDDDDASDDEYVPKRRAAKASRKRNTDGKKESKPRAKGTGFTRAYKLSPELASFMGQEESARHEVVKKMWTVIKERNLLDPKNKQFAIADDEIRKIMGVKKFRTFGMLKYLKSHFLD